MPDLGVKYNVTWPMLRNIPDEGVMFGNADVLVVPITGFSPGVGQFGAGDELHVSALVKHYFAGSWRGNS